MLINNAAPFQFLVVAIGLVMLMVSGCMVGPNYRVPQTTVPTA